MKPNHPPVLCGGRDGAEDACHDEDDGDGRGEVDDGGEGDVALGEEGDEVALAEVGPGGGGGHQDAAELPRGEEGKGGLRISVVPFLESAIAFWSWFALNWQ